MSHEPADGAEVLLAGGITNAGRVHRAGATVRRPARPTGAGTRALLLHLERAGFDGAPRHLGTDPQGHEVLSYVEGEVPIEPVPPWVLEDATLVGVAALLRRYHDAAASFDPAGHPWPRPVPARFRGGLLCHNDPNRDNVVFAGGRAVALIDFDLAGPATAAWDVACAARLWVPLRADADLPEPLRGSSLARLRLFADAYGLPAGDRDTLVDALVPAHAWAYDVVREAVADGHAGFGRYWDDGGRAQAERTRRWLEDHGPRMRHALSRAA